MSGLGQPEKYFIGWDVGGWNCDKNRASRDAIVILDGKRNLVGMPWRGNLRVTINKADTPRAWLEALFKHCQADLPEYNMQAVIAIDTPLGFPESFRRLLGRSAIKEKIGKSGTNPYLFRKTEQILFDHGLRPLSAIKDMIGSQATKGLHFLAKFTSQSPQCGVWTDGLILTAIEAYPSACKKSFFIKNMLAHHGITEFDYSQKLQEAYPIDHQDKMDALVCALIAHTYNFHIDALADPPDSIPMSEGWIWVPKDVLQQYAPEALNIN